MRKIVAVLAILVSAVAFSACGSDSKSKDKPANQGYHNMNTLAASIKEEANNKLSSENSDVTLDEVVCIKDSVNVATCHGTGSDGSSEVVTAHISQNGDTWITEQ